MPNKPKIIRLHKPTTRPQNLAVERETQVIELMAVYLEQPRLLSGITALVNRLAHQFQCVRVSLGLVKGKHIQMMAISGNHQFDRRTQLVRKIEAAMNEMLDQKSTLSIPDQRGSDLNISRAHQTLASEHGLHAVCTIPLANHSEIIGAITLESKATDPFEPSTIQIGNTLGRLVGPVIHLKHLQERHPLEKIHTAVQYQLKTIFGSGFVKKKTILASAVTLLALVSLVDGTFRVSTDAVLEGSIQRVISAPIEGYLSEVNVRPGDEVTAGQLMGAMDDRDLQLERLKWNSQHQQQLREYREVLAKHDRTQVNIFRAKMDQTSAQVKLIDEQLRRLKITAPFKGVVIGGDLDQQLGSPVERGQVLFKVAPLDGYRIIFKVDESDISYIKTGQVGALLLTSLPDQELSLTISKITPVSIAEDGRNYFRVEASLDKPNSKLRPGMAGVGKIDIGKRKLAWLASYRLINRIRLWLWMHL